MTTLTFLTPAEVVELNRLVCETAGVAPNPPRDGVLLDLVCARPQMADYEDLHGTIAVLMEGLMNSRPFVRLNTATSLAAMNCLLGLHGLRLACSVTNVNRAFQDWREQRVTWQGIAAWLRLVAEPV